MQSGKETSIAQWYMVGLSNEEAKALIGHLEGTKKYGTLVSYQNLPEAAKAVIRAEYDKLPE